MPPRPPFKLVTHVRWSETLALSRVPESCPFGPFRWHSAASEMCLLPNAPTDSSLPPMSFLKAADLDSLSRLSGEFSYFTQLLQSGFSPLCSVIRAWSSLPCNSDAQSLSFSYSQRNCFGAARLSKGATAAINTLGLPEREPPAFFFACTKPTVFCRV